jgi:hypothetical protein
MSGLRCFRARIGMSGAVLAVSSAQSGAPRRIALR